MTSQCLASSDGDVCSWLFLFLQEKGARPARPVSCRRSKVSYIPPPHPAPPPHLSFPWMGPSSMGLGPLVHSQPRGW